MFRLADGRRNVYQWDINVKLLLDESNESADEVHFSARFSRISLSVEVVHTEDSSYVTIPNILLQKPNDIIAYSYITNADGSYTKYDTIIPVIARPKPSGYIYEETEILTWKSLDDKINDLGESTVNSVKYTEQYLTDEQKAQARTNIGAVSINEVPRQAQADWLQNDNAASDFVKNRTHYSELQFIKKARLIVGTWCFDNINLASLSPICIEINGTLHTDLYGDTLYGDTDSSVWENGGGMGFYIKYKSMIRRYEIYIDTKRYGSIENATINLYSQTVKKVLSSYYLPVATGNTIGGVKVDECSNEEIEDYERCAIDSKGSLYSKKYNAAKIYSELSIANLQAMRAYVGDHGLFTDSVAEDFQSYGLTLPVHAWFIGMNLSTYASKFILESADGASMLVTVKNSIVQSASVLAKPFGGCLTVTKEEDPNGNFFASHSASEIYKAFQSGKSVQLSHNDTIYQLCYCDSYEAEFSAIETDAGQTITETKVINNDKNIISQTKGKWNNLYPVNYVLNSSTEGSNKRFRITVDDSGTLSATEVTE